MKTYRGIICNAGFGILTVVTTKSMVFWFVTPCSSEKYDVSKKHISFIFRTEE
jgi:hypothetical protein